MGEMNISRKWLVRLIDIDYSVNLFNAELLPYWPNVFTKEEAKTLIIKRMIRSVWNENYFERHFNGLWAD